MNRKLSRTLAAFGLVMTLALAAPGIAMAQGTQNNESDVEFLKRMIASLKQTERLSAKLEENIGKAARMATTNAMSTGNDPLETGNRYGARTRNTTGNRDSDYRRAEMSIRSTKNKAIKEREKLSELQRSGDDLDPKEREKIESTVNRLERDVEAMNRNMQQGRF